MPPLPKHHSTRARRNRSTTRTTLTVAEPVDYRSWSMRELEAELRERGLPHTVRSKASAAARLADNDADVPELPQRHAGWHDETRKWWRDIWMSPMHDEWTDSDVHNAFMLAGVYDDFWRATSSTGRKEAASEFRLQRQSLGLDPLARRKLEWTIEQAGEAKEKGEKRRRQSKQEPTSDPAPKPGDDPRQSLELVS